MRPARTTKKANPVNSGKNNTTASSQGRRDAGAVVSKCLSSPHACPPSFRCASCGSTTATVQSQMVIWPPVACPATLFHSSSNYLHHNCSANNVKMASHQLLLASKEANA